MFKEPDFSEDPNLLECPTDEKNQLYAPLENNFMSYYYDYTDLTPEFTAEQAEVMRCVVDNELENW